MLDYLTGLWVQNTCKGVALVVVFSACLLALAGCQTAPLHLNDGQGDLQLPPTLPLFTGAAPSLASPQSAGIAGAAGQLAAPGEVTQSRSGPDLWGRLRAGFALTETAQPVKAPATLPDAVLALRVDAHVRWHQQNQPNLTRTFTRARLVLFDIVEAVERAGMPLELALLPAIESAFQPDVCSQAAACGLWQFIVPTARRFDLKRHLFSDERRHVRAGTAAALRYLKELHTRFNGDWHLALAAYNCGEGCVERAVKQARKAGLAGRFTDLRLPNETAQYVPRLLALAQVVADPQAHGLTFPALDNAPYFVAHRITRDVDVALAARLAGMRMQDFLALNAHHQKPVIVAASDPLVFVPVAQAAKFAQALTEHRGPLSSWRAVRVHSHSSTEAIARAHGADLAQFRAVNGIQPKHSIQAGSTVLVPRHGHENAADVSLETVLKGTLNLNTAATHPRVNRRQGAIKSDVL